jgi:class 3 adenylate cyclase
MKWAGIVAILAVFSVPIVAILASEAPEALTALILGGALLGASAFVARSPIGEALADYIRAKARAKAEVEEPLLFPHRVPEISPEERKTLETHFPEGIVAILFTDMEDFTRYVERGDEAAFAMLKEHNRLIRQTVERWGGRVVKGYGDGFMIAFSSVRRAVAAAVALQRQFEAYNQGRPEGEQIRVRIGIDVGEPIREGDDYIGRAVNLAARITAQAEGGRILVSETVKRLAGPLPGLQYVDRGLFALKGFKEKQRLYEVAPIPALAHPLDSDIEAELARLEDEIRRRERAD